MSRLGALWLVALILGSFPARAQTPSFRITTYNQLQGLPSGYIFDIEQDATGTIWVATDKGLARYDGANFTTYSRDDGLPANQIYHITPTHGQALWLATLEGGAARFSSQRIEIWDSATHQLPMSTVFHALEDGRGNRYFYSSKGLAVHDGQRMHFLPNTGGTVYHYDLMTLLPDGAVMARLNGQIMRVSMQDGRPVQEVMALPPALHKMRLGYLRFQRVGDTLWMSVGGGIVALRYHSGKLHYLTEYQLNLNATAFYVGKDYLFTVGTRSGLHAIPLRPGLPAWQFSTRDGLAEDFCQSVIQDYEGNIWLGTFGGGVQKLQPNPLMTTPWPRPAVRVLPLRDQSLLFADAQELVLVPNKGAFLHQPLEMGSRVQALFQDANADLWIGTLFEAIGPLKLREMGNTLAFRQKRMPCSGTSALARWQGDLYVGHYGDGISRWDGHRLLTWKTTANGLASNMVEQLVVLGDHLVAVHLDRGLSLVAPDGKMQRLVASDGLAGNSLRAVFADAGTLWTATPNRVTAHTLGGDTRHYQFPLVAPPRQILLLFRDHSGRLWLVGDRYLYHQTPQGFRVMGSLPLVNDTQIITCAAYNPETDILAMGFSAGVHRLRMQDVHVADIPPRLLLRQAKVSGKPVTLTEGRLSTGVAPQDVEFDFSVTSYVNERLNLVQVRLEGYDTNWVNLGPDMRARFPRLPAGTYELYARAVNADGLSSRDYWLLTLRVPAPFYQQWWFWVLLLLLATALGALGARYVFLQRLKRERRRRQLAEALQRERERISRDL
ncbi:MAG: hypothetical protein KF690_09550, partial [Bacteroidetes bacterium]|nr:hypothetical protein [Bacteroidota bacterium]